VCAAGITSTQVSHECTPTNPRAKMEEDKSEKWGRGAGILTSARRRSMVNSSSPNGGDEDSDGHHSGGNLFPPNNDDIEFGVDDNDNPFESIGRELDNSVGDTNRVVEGMKSSPDEADAAVDADDCLSRQSGNVELITEKYFGVIDTVKKNEMTSVDKTENGTVDMPQKEHNNDKYPTSYDDKPSSEKASQRQHVSITAKHGSTLTSSVMKKISPTRFTFQSSGRSISSTRPNNINSFKTPANNKSLPSRELFSSSSGAMTQRSNIVNATTQSSNSLYKSTVKRHTFRRSTDNSAAANNTPSVNNNLREMGFVPTFLQATKSRSGTTLDVPENGDDDDCDDYNINSPKREGAPPSSFNMISEHHRQQQQKQHKSNRSAKLGPLVQRMHALRNANQRMVMRLHSGQFAISPGGGGGVSGNSFLASRKRRRSGGEYLVALDVTVSGASLSFDTTIGNCGTLLAYIHSRTEIKGPSSSGQFVERLNLPCYARLIMSRDVIRERGIVDDCIIKQLRLFDAIIIPSILVMTEDLDERGGPLDDVDWNRNNMMQNMPTIICANICQDYPADKPPSQDVSFNQFHNP